MTGPDRDLTGYAIICLDAEPGVLQSLRRDVTTLCGDGLAVLTCATADDALRTAEDLANRQIRIPLILMGNAPTTADGIDLLLQLHARPDCRAARKVLVADHAESDDLVRALRQGAIHRVMGRPWTDDEVVAILTSVLTSYFIHHEPDDAGRFPKVIDSAQFPTAYRAARQEQRTLDLQLRTLKRSFLANTEMTGEELDSALGAAIDEALDSPQRQDFPAGSILLRQGEPVATLYFLVSGQIQLSRMADGRELVLHEETGGRIVGLLALAYGLKGFYTWRAKTDITVVPLSLIQLEAALMKSPLLSGYLVTSLIRTVGRRSNHTSELLLEVELLNDRLQAERDQLAGTVEQLKETQMRLVESEKMATLGQLSAGVAHELNNPVAAIQRSVDFMSEDLVSLVIDSPDGKTLGESLTSALSHEPLTTREHRQRRADLTRTVGDKDLAARLLNAGITTPEEYRRRFGRLSGSKRDRMLAKMERYCQLGSSLRNIAHCSQRVAEIVSSLRSYTRADQTPVADVRIHEGLDGTLLMFGHALRNVEVRKTYGDLPAIECRAGELNQVWTNIISNALQAMHNEGSLLIETDAPDPDHVRVRITDSGPGIPPEDLARVFELNYTTKQGQSGFGLGMGLAICHDIVTRHAGTIAMESEPGRTCVSVTLPLRSPESTG